MKISKSFKIYIHIIVLSLLSQNLNGAEDFSKNVIIHEKPQIISELKFKEKFEDIHLNIEKKLFELIGPSAGFLHTARSRNDQVVTDFKLWIKKSSKETIDNINSLMKILIKIAEKNVDTVMPGLTHLKNAQPISFAHYLLSYFEMFKSCLLYTSDAADE